MCTSVSFSLVTYATVGYGDVVRNEEWRVLAGIEALAGVMMRITVDDDHALSSPVVIHQKVKTGPKLACP